MIPVPGSYGCVKTHGFYPWLIRAGTRSEYDHAFIIVDDRGGIIEAEPGGARRSNLAEYTNYDMIFNTVDVPSEEQRRRIVSKAETLIGTPYGWTDIARLALHDLGVNWPWLIAAADNERAMICSQLVAVCGAAGGMDWSCGKENPAAVTPADLATRIGHPHG